MPLQGVLINLRAMARNNHLSSEDAPVLRKLVNILRDPIALRASKLDPLDILVILAQAEVGWKLPNRGVPNHKESIKKRVPQHTIHSSVIQELRNMLATSLSCVPKMSPITMVVCVDTRNNLTDESFGCWPLSISRSLSVTLLSLLHAGADIRLVSMTPEGPAPIPLGVGDTVQAVTARLESLPRSGQIIDPSKLLTWVRQTQGMVDLVLLATHSTNPVEDRVSHTLHTICIYFIILQLYIRPGSGSRWNSFVLTRTTSSSCTGPCTARRCTLASGTRLTPTCWTSPASLRMQSGFCRPTQRTVSRAFK